MGAEIVSNTNHHQPSHSLSIHPPHTGSGKPPQRGLFLRTPFRSEELLRVYQDVRREYQEHAFEEENDNNNKTNNNNNNRKIKNHWRILNQRDGVEVSLLEHPTDPSCPYVRIRGIIPSPVEDCWNFLRVENWNVAMPQMDPFYEGVSVHGQYNVGKIRMILCRKRTKRLLTYGKRDLVFLSVTDVPRTADGALVSGTVSIRCSQLPRYPGYTRAFQDSIAFYQPIRGNTATHLTIVCRIDLNDSGEDGTGGYLPMWLYVKTIGYTAAQSILRLRQALLKA